MDIPVPDLGEFADVEIIEILVKVGDRIEPEDPLVSLETDKATMDVPSPAGGNVVAVKVAVGDRVSAGDVLVVLDGEDKGAEASAAGSRSESKPRATAGDDAVTRNGVSGGAVAPDATADDVDAGAVSPRSVVVPDLGDFDSVEIIDVLVAEGDEVDAEQGLVTLETDKATMDVPAPEPGRILSLSVKVGDRISTGDEILKLAPSSASASGESPEISLPRDARGRDAENSPRQSRGAAAAAERTSGDKAGAAAARAAAEDERGGAASGGPRSTRAATSAASAPLDEKSFARAHASPSVRKLARELGVDLGRVRGSGRKGRVTADDVKSFVKAILRDEGDAARGRGLPAVPTVDFAKFGEVEQIPLGRIQRISSTRLHASWVNIPHVTQHDEADITALEETRQSLKEAAQERGIKLTPLAFVLRACVLTLEEFPRFKASLSADGESLIMKRYTHVGFAADTPNGLIVPVIRDADRKDVYELATSLATLSEKARGGKLKSDDIQGGVFTVSSLGGIGGTFFTPIINAPEVAILGVSRSQQRPVWRDGKFVPRLILPLSLSYDHRVIDGAEAVRFTTRLAEVLAEAERLIEAIP